MKAKKYFQLIIFSMMIALLLSACSETGNTESEEGQQSNSGNDEVINIRLAGTLPVNNHVTTSLDVFADYVNENSDGKVNVTVYPSGQLYTDNEIIDGVPNGAIEMGQVNPDKFGGNVPITGIFTIPGLITQTEHLYEAVDGEMGEIVKGELENNNVELLAWFSYGLAYLASTDEPINSEESFEGKQVRATNYLGQSFIEEMGGSPVSMGGGEVPEALARGVIDSAFSGLTSFSGRKYYDFSDYYTGPYFAYTQALIANKDWYDSLPDDVRQIIQEGAAEAQQFTRDRMEEEKKASEEEMTENGMEYVEANDEERAAWLEKADPIINEWLDETGSKGKEALDIVREITQN